MPMTTMVQSAHKQWRARFLPPLCVGWFLADCCCDVLEMHDHQCRSNFPPRLEAYRRGGFDGSSHTLQPTRELPRGLRLSVSYELAGGSDNPALPFPPKKTGLPFRLPEGSPKCTRWLVKSR